MTRSRRRLKLAPPVVGLLAVLACGGCGSGSGAPSASSPGAAQATPSPSGASGGGTTAITLAGALSGALTTHGAACVDQGAAGFQVTIAGTVAGANDVLKFDAPGGTTDLSVRTTADIVVLFLQLPAGPSWTADPRSSKGSGTIEVNGSTGGTVNLHLVPSTGSSATGTLDVSGPYACSSNISQ